MFATFNVREAHDQSALLLDKGIVRVTVDTDGTMITVTGWNEADQQVAARSTNRPVAMHTSAVSAILAGWAR